MKRLPVFLSTLALSAGVVAILNAQSSHSVLIRASKPYDRVVAAIERAGGTVTHRYSFVDGVAATIPGAALPEIERLVGPDNISRDEVIPMPEVADPKGEVADAAVEAASSSR
jgi:hypothetical protein